MAKYIDINYHYVWSRNVEFSFTFENTELDTFSSSTLVISVVGADDDGLTLWG